LAAAIGEEIDGLDEGDIVRQSIYRCIVQMINAHQQVWMVCHRKLSQDVVQVPWADLGGSARRLGVFCQPDNVF